MEKAVQSTAEVSSLGAPAKGESGLFSTRVCTQPAKIDFCRLSSVGSSDAHCSVD